ncbi:hypothetical protein P7K49_011673 [Saguinus oedipus]|uniref:Uncharacterized protein n=1 Tax=Saguinus oedipus TaxID=9490 RepID=A0ABQ9VRN6_SAGOE|nr:hypothetical protein P7K49_011673 [Saguinus oedipus]
MRDLKTQGQLWEAARAQGCPQNSLEMLQLGVRDSNSVADAHAWVTEGRVDILGEPRETLGLLGAFSPLRSNHQVPRPREHKGTGGAEGDAEAAPASVPTVCNSGQDLLGPLEALGVDAVGSVLDVNMAGKVRMLQAVLPEMKRRSSGADKAAAPGSSSVELSLEGRLRVEGQSAWRGTVCAGMAPWSLSLGNLFSSHQVCPSMTITAPASLRWKAYARVWRFCCRPLGSSE